MMISNEKLSKKKTEISFWSFRFIVSVNAPTPTHHPWLFSHLCLSKSDSPQCKTCVSKKVKKNQSQSTNLVKPDPLFFIVVQQLLQQ